MVAFGGAGADRDAQHAAVVEDRAGEQRVASGIRGLDQRVGRGVRSIDVLTAQRDAQQVQRVRRDDLEPVVVGDPASQFLRQ